MLFVFVTQIYPRIIEITFDACFQPFLDVDLWTLQGWMQMQRTRLQTLPLSRYQREQLGAGPYNHLEEAWQGGLPLRKSKFPLPFLSRCSRPRQRKGEKSPFSFSLKREL